MNDAQIQPYLDGKILYGDDFTEDEILKWFALEQEGYANLGAKNADTYRYSYHSLNKLLGYNFLFNKKDYAIESALGFGSAYGDEFNPILCRIKKITIIDPSEAFVKNEIRGIPITYVKPSHTGDLQFKDNSFDYISCLSALHHIPNVSKVVKELGRVLKPGCYMLLREPIVSMGDWRYKRGALTPNERGIPLDILKRIIRESGLVIERLGLFGFPVTDRFLRLVVDIYNNDIATWIDIQVSKMFYWNINYHPRNIWRRFRPTSAFFVLRKPGIGDSI